MDITFTAPDGLITLVFIQGYVCSLVFFSVLLRTFFLRILLAIDAASYKVAQAGVITQYTILSSFA